MAHSDVQTLKDGLLVHLHNADFYFVFLFGSWNSEEI